MSILFLTFQETSGKYRYYRAFRSQGKIMIFFYPDCYFDVVVSYRFLPHEERWESLLQEAARVARKAVIIDYPKIHSINYFTPLLFTFKKCLEKGLTPLYTCFHERDLVGVFKKNGFTRVERYAEFFLPMVFHRILKSLKMAIFLENIFRSTGHTEKYGSPVILKLTRDETE
jgi:hypothetical protein